MARRAGRVVDRLFRRDPPATVAHDGDALGPDHRDLFFVCNHRQPGQVNYAAAKAGLIGAVRALSLEVAGRGITVNAVAPGVINSPAVRAALDARRIAEIVPAKRAGRPEEVADLVAFLASERAGYISGQTISVNGGMA